MATTTRITLTAEQRAQIAQDLRIDKEQVPDEIAIVSVSPEAGASMGMPEDMKGRFAPALIIT
jgi:hypothetical protein